MQTKLPNFQMFCSFSNFQIVCNFCVVVRTGPNLRVPDRFFGIRDFPYLSGSGFEIEGMRRRWDAKNNHRDYSKFWVGIRGLKNPFGDPLICVPLKDMCTRKRVKNLLCSLALC